MTAGIVGWGLVILAMGLFGGARAGQIALFAFLGLLAQATGSGLVGMLELPSSDAALWTHVGSFTGFALIGSAIPLALSLPQAGLGLWLSLEIGCVLATGRLPDGQAYLESGAVILLVTGMVVLLAVHVMRRPVELGVPKRQSSKGRCRRNRPGA